jgi:hypothetical protein
MSSFLRNQLLALLVLMLSPLFVHAQCSKTWVRKKCIPKIAPFIHNGQMNSTMLREGETADLALTVYSGQDYRILICHDEVLENVNFRLIDNNKKVIFDSRDHNNTDVWDFKVRTTMQLKVEVVVDKNEDTTTGIVSSGCVSILVGFKQ